ncbi:hypothetical protein OSB04_023154 [Centaurea solstitialis]|uniref:Homeobox domain-containing protein n=1 Tax=Centaurea solstitialis TaxID=347529 RepID=A0AA38T242_9ASTR|nr:hypothetical protein OSB04_023154 [Centaurea solstitialis]
MQRRAASVQSWADRLSLHGSEVTSTQLKNWLNNRKAKLARAAAQDTRIPPRTDIAFIEKQGGSGTNPVSDSPESPVDESSNPSPSASHGTHQQDETSKTVLGNESSETIIPTSSFRREHGQQVMLTNDQQEEIGKGKIHLANGIWFGRNLEESGLCVVDVNDLKVDLSTDLPHPCDATGTTFGQAEQILGRKRVLWDSSKLLLIQQQMPPR